MCIRDRINANYEEGSLQQVKMHDGSQLNLHKLAKDWNPMDKRSAMNAVPVSYTHLDVYKRQFRNFYFCR